ncbi:hypothetical protein M758_5G079500 [Ceratodon purpureus]|nr:hypothetical protein M758_5G079500 [Ceratodon purpureus]
MFSPINSTPGHLTKTLQTNAKTLHILLRLVNESSLRIILTLSLKHHPNTPNTTLNTRLNHQSSNSHRQLPNSKNHPNSTQLNSTHTQPNKTTPKSIPLHQSTTPQSSKTHKQNPNAHPTDRPTPKTHLQ